MNHIDLIDDDPEQLDLLALVLRRLLPTSTIRPHLFDDGLYRALVDGSAVLVDGTSAVVVVDAHLPGRPLAAVITAIGQADPGLPVVVISGSEDPEARQAALAVGALAWQDKPFRLADARLLADRLVRLVRRADTAG